MTSHLEVFELFDLTCEFLPLEDWKEVKEVSLMEKRFFRGLEEFNQPKVLFKLSLKKHNLDFLLKLLKRHQKLNPTTTYLQQTALIAACRFGHIPLLDFLLSYQIIDPSIDDNMAIGYASCQGHTKVVYRLLQDRRVNPSVRNNIAILNASYYGHFAIFCLLLNDSRVNPSASGNWATKGASKNGHFNVVCRLMQDHRVDPSADNNVAVKIARKKVYRNVVERLSMDARVVL